MQALHTDLCVDREKWRVWFGVCRLILEIQLREEYSVVGLGFRFLSITCPKKNWGLARQGCFARQECLAASSSSQGMEFVYEDRVVRAM